MILKLQSNFSLRSWLFLLLLLVANSTAGKPITQGTIQILRGNTYQINVGQNNVVVINTNDGLVLIDGGKKSQAPAMQTILKQQFPNKSNSLLINTHCHTEQTGLNEFFGKKNLPIIAHINAKQWLEQKHYDVWNNKIIDPLPSYAIPTKTFFKNHEITQGNIEIYLGYLPLAHTDNDIYVHIKNDNVIAIGGLINTNQWPVIDWWSAGWFGGLLDGLETILAIADDETIIVPAHGPAISKQILQQEYDMYVVLFDRILSLLKQSKSPTEAVTANPTKGYHPQWPNKDEFVESAFRSFYGHLRGEKRMGLMP